MENKRNDRNIIVYIAAMLTALAAIIDTLIALNSQWPLYFYFVIWIQMAIIIFTAVYKRIPLKVQSVIFALCVWHTIFQSGFYFQLVRYP